ncbi:MAG: competence/damage-inducible protein A [Syntrophaceae bacterium]
MKVGILTIGNELTSGKTQDTNSSFIARHVNIQGWQVSVMMSVSDDDDAIKKGLDYIMSLSDTVVITGGLGPTTDDITTAAVARAFGCGLYTDEVVLKSIQERFERYRLKWTDNNAKQAAFPEGAETIRNPVGTAWGFFLRKSGKIIAVIPGVPAEVKKMLPEGVIPVFRKEYGTVAEHVESRIIKLSGIIEARVDEALADVDFGSIGVSVGFYPNFPEIQVVLTARCATEQEAKERVKKAEEYVSQRLQQYIFAYDQDTLEGIVAAMLTDKKLTLAVAESCTGGLITDRLTDIPGSSNFLERGVISYSNKSKTDLLGVPEEIIRDFGAVSEQTAVLMAEGMRRTAGTDLGLATTGIAGPAGGTEEKPVGTVFIALADGGKTLCRKYSFRWDRRRNKTITSQVALMMIKRYLAGRIEHE